MTANQVKSAISGDWISIAPEVRPSAFRNSDGSLRPFYLTRRFTFRPDDSFTLEITNFGDPFGQLPLVRMFIGGHLEWKGDHPIAPDAQKADFTADTRYDVTPLHPSFADILNKTARQDFEPWVPGQLQDILKKAFLPFGLAKDQVFKEYDLIYLHGGMMFWGARHVDGRGFDTDANRPTNLQIPLIRTS
jgi:hypothetical protein